MLAGRGSAQRLALGDQSSFLVVHGSEQPVSDGDLVLDLGDLLLSEVIGQPEDDQGDDEDAGRQPRGHQMDAVERLLGLLRNSRLVVHGTQDQGRQDAAEQHGELEAESDERHHDRGQPTAGVQIAVLDRVGDDRPQAAHQDAVAERAQTAESQHQGDAGRRQQAEQQGPGCADRQPEHHSAALAEVPDQPRHDGDANNRRQHVHHREPGDHIGPHGEIGHVVHARGRLNRVETVDAEEQQEHQHHVLVVGQLVDHVLESGRVLVGGDLDSLHHLS